MASDRPWSAPAAPHGQLEPRRRTGAALFRHHGMLERRAAEHDLSIVQTRLLGVLRDRKPTMNELARLLELDKSSVSGLVDRAERRGLVVARSLDDRPARGAGQSHGRRAASLVSAAAAASKRTSRCCSARLPPRDRAALSGSSADCSSPTRPSTGSICSRPQASKWK